MKNASSRAQLSGIKRKEGEIEVVIEAGRVSEGRKRIREKELSFGGPPQSRGASKRHREGGNPREES